MNTHDKNDLPTLPEPDSYLYQHEETGLTEYVCSQQVEWGFEKANPRWQKIHGAFTERQMQDYARTAIEADRKRRGISNECEPVKYERLSGWTRSGIESLCISLDIQQEQTGGGSKACAVAASLLRGIAEQHFSEAREP